MEISVVTEDESLLPSYATEHAAGADVRANIASELILLPGESILISTGLFLEIPLGYEVQIRPRSGLALHNQVTVLNSPGTIDADYRGEVKVILINHGKTPFTILPKMRIAQMVVSPVVVAKFKIQQELVQTGRGKSGFGHSGVN